MKWKTTSLLWCALAYLAAAQELPSPATPFDQSVRPFLSSNCNSCHNGKLKSGGLDLQAYTSGQALKTDRQKWELVLRKLQTGEMPPKGLPRPDAASLKKVTSWITAEFDRIDNAASPDPGRITARRLNRTEYNNTVRDLLGIDFQPAGDFPQDDSGYGFDNIADVLSISPLLMEKYMAAAEKISHTAISGPDSKPSVTRYQPPNRRRLEKNSEKEILLAPLTTAPPYTIQDYDVTGLGQPSSIHITHRFPATAEYVFNVAVGHNRPPGWDPLQIAIWVDGKIAAETEIAPDEREVVLTGDREAIRELRCKVPAGAHWIAATFLRQFEGVPASYGGPNPTKRVQPPPPPPPDVTRLLPIPPNATPAEIAAIEGKRKAFKIKQAPDTPDGIRVNWMSIAGPFNAEGASDESLRHVFTCGHLNGNHVPGCERKIVANLTRSAFRRPVAPREIDRYVQLISNARARGRSFNNALAVALQAILISPDFLFRIERDTSPAQVHEISQYELAARLSYFLWSSMPDQQLLHGADLGELRKPEIFHAEVRRMLLDPKSRALVENFSDQWLETRRLESVRPDRERFPDFEDYLRLSMREETERFFAYVMREDRSILDFIDGNYTFVNERLARHYKIPGVTGPEFRKVDLTGTHRRGVLTQAGVLTVSSYGNRTSPVLRGKWVLENFLNAPPPPPPPDVPSLDETAAGSAASLRKQLEQHRANAVCASCHSKMDPLGFALENFDAVGQWRSTDGKLPIDSSGELPDGKSFHGAEELAGILASEPDVFARCLTEKMLVYALGRGLEPYDRRAVKKIASGLAAHDNRFSSLIFGIVDSMPFQQRRGEQPSNDSHP